MYCTNAVQVHIQEVRISELFFCNSRLDTLKTWWKFELELNLPLVSLWTRLQLLYYCVCKTKLGNVWLLPSDENVLLVESYPVGRHRTVEREQNKRSCQRCYGNLWREGRGVSEENLFWCRKEGKKRYFCLTGGSWHGAKSIACWEFVLKAAAPLMCYWERREINVAQWSSTEQI